MTIYCCLVCGRHLTGGQRVDPRRRVKANEGPLFVAETSSQKGIFFYIFLCFSVFVVFSVGGYDHRVSGSQIWVATCEFRRDGFASSSWKNGMKKQHGGSGEIFRGFDVVWNT